MRKLCPRAARLGVLVVVRRTGHIVNDGCYFCDLVSSQAAEETAVSPIRMPLVTAGFIGSKGSCSCSP